MARPKEWLRLTREWHLSELSTWATLHELLEEINLRFSRGYYDENPQLLVKDLFKLNSKIGEGHGLSREIQSTLENNGTGSFAKKEVAVLRRHPRKE